MTNEQKRAIEAAIRHFDHHGHTYAEALRALLAASTASDKQEAVDAMDTLVAVLNAIGYTEAFAAAHPNLKVGEGVKLFLSEQGHPAYRESLDALVGSYDHMNEIGGAHAEEMFELNAEKARAVLDKSASDKQEQRLDKPAQVNHTRFGKGVKWSTVIGAAQRYYEFMQTPEKEALRIESARAFFEGLANPSDKGAEQEPIYQMQLRGSDWADVEKRTFDDLPRIRRRIVYAVKEPK